MTDNSPEWLSLVREKVETLRYGVVQIVIHDSKVTQIERTEKTRINPRGTTEASPTPNTSAQPDKLAENEINGAPNRTTGSNS